MKTDEKVKKIFEANKALRTLYVFPDDGNIFSNRNFAINHQRTIGKIMKVVNREDLAGEAQPETIGSTSLLEDQLLSIDLQNPEGPMYNVYKQLRDGLGIKTSDNKMATIVAALAEEQKKLKNQKPE